MILRALILTRPDSSLRYRRYINHLLTYLLTYLLYSQATMLHGRLYGTHNAPFLLFFPITSNILN